jgi:hypothetical protein
MNEALELYKISSSCQSRAKRMPPTTGKGSGRPAPPIFPQGRLRPASLRPFDTQGGRRGSRARVAEEAIAEARELLAHRVLVSHLADQLLLPLALAGRGTFRTLTPSDHTRTHAAVIQRFLDLPIRITKAAPAYRS